MAYNNFALRDLADEIIADLKKQQRFDVGDIMRHEDGRIVKVTGGQYWGTHGLSNHWTFREVLADDSLGPDEHGYGYVLVDKAELEGRVLELVDKVD